MVLPIVLDAAIVIVPHECRGINAGTDCKLSSFKKLIVNIANLIMGIVGSLALLMFMYGGLLIMIGSRGGDKKDINTGKVILTNAIIGIIIVLGSYLLVQGWIYQWGGRITNQNLLEIDPNPSTAAPVTREHPVSTSTNP